MLHPYAKYSTEKFWSYTLSTNSSARAHLFNKLQVEPQAKLFLSKCLDITNFAKSSKAGFRCTKKWTISACACQFLGGNRAQQWWPTFPASLISPQSISPFFKNILKKLLLSPEPNQPVLRWITTFSNWFEAKK